MLYPNPPTHSTHPPDPRRGIQKSLDIRTDSLRLRTESPSNRQSRHLKIIDPSEEDPSSSGRDQIELFILDPDHAPPLGVEAGDAAATPAAASGGSSSGSSRRNGGGSDDDYDDSMDLDDGFEDEGVGILLDGEGERGSSAAGGGTKGAGRRLTTGGVTARGEGRRRAVVSVGRGRGGGSRGGSVAGGGAAGLSGDGNGTNTCGAADK